MKKISLHGFGLFSDKSLRKKYQAGEVIFKPHDPSNHIYIVVEGKLRFSMYGNDVDFFTTGDLFGEMGVVENRPRHGLVTAVTNCTLILISRSHFDTLIREQPDFATRVMAVISTRLHRRTKIELKKRSLERELAIGHKMQLALLPQTTPQIPGWQFATHYRSAWQVGGDFYDFIVRDDDPSKLCLVIADVTGKGVPAALLMAVARTLLRAETRKGQSAADVVQRVNEVITNDNRSPLFLSTLYAILNVESGLLQYASAGHDPPFRLRHDTKEIEVLPSSGFLLGAFSGVSFSQQEATLAVGDVLLLYTDGVTEARDKHGRFFGDARLREAILASADGSAEEIVSGVVTAVHNFIGSATQSDDLTMVVAKRLS